ncbi:MAG: hypothetical protein V8R40_07705 [Dysosmobacter sp.]
MYVRLPTTSEVKRKVFDALEHLAEKGAGCHRLQRGRHPSKPFKDSMKTPAR